MKRSPLKRNKPLESRTSLKRTGFKPKPKTSAQKKKLSAWREAVILRDKNQCRICEAIKAGKIPADEIPEHMIYHKNKMEVHHFKGRGKFMYDVDNSGVLYSWHHRHSPLAPHHRPKAFKAIAHIIKPERKEI